MPKISVIVPVYKVENYLNRCVDSILNQTFSDFELILVDDGSPDNCGKICDEYALKDDRVVVIHKENGGLSDARNAGINWMFTNSNSEWLTFIDSDDYVHKDFLEILYSTIKKYNVKICCCGHQPFNDKSEYNDVPFEYETCIDTAENLVRKNYSYYDFNISVAWGRLFHRTVWEELRFPYGKFHEDEYTIYKALYENGDVVVVKATLYYYFQNENGIMHEKPSIRKVLDHLNSLRQQTEFFLKNRYVNSFQFRFNIYCKDFNNFRNHLSINEQYKSLYVDHSRYIKLVLKENKADLPPLLKKYGYNNWVRGKANRFVNLKTRFNELKKTKNLFYCLIWYFVNYFRIWRS